MVSSTAAACNRLLTLSPPSNSSPFSKRNTHQLKPPINNSSSSKNKNDSSLRASPSTPIVLLSQKSQSQALPLQTTPSTTTSSVTVKLRHLASEFNSLTEPIERVKRLLHYAALLPPLGDSDRVPENRVAGCSTQVWLVSGMDEEGRMRFRADSDSEISKGFCWCLVWALDGSEPHEVLRVEKEELGHVDVLGLGLKAQSRVNTWHNVLFGMQKATRDLALRMELQGKGFPSSMVDDGNDDDQGSGGGGGGGVVLPNGKFSGVGVRCSLSRFKSHRHHDTL